MSTKLALVTAAASALLLALPAHAQWYAGVSAGKSDIKFDNAAQSDQFLDLGFTNPVTTSSTRDTGFRLFGGYQLHRYVAIEAAYVDLGSFDFKTDVRPTGSLTGGMSITGFELSAVGTLPINDKFGLYARVGALAGETKTAYTGAGSVQVLIGGETQKKRSTQLAYGAGVTYNINSQLSVRGEWARYTKLGSVLTGGETDANLYSIGIAYRF